MCGQGLNLAIVRGSEGGGVASFQRMLNNKLSQFVVNSSSAAPGWTP